MVYQRQSMLVSKPRDRNHKVLTVECVRVVAWLCFQLVCIAGPASVLNVGLNVHKQFGNLPTQPVMYMHRTSGCTTSNTLSSGKGPSMVQRQLLTKLTHAHQLQNMLSQNQVQVSALALVHPLQYGTWFTKTGTSKTSPTSSLTPDTPLTIWEQVHKTGTG